MHAVLLAASRASGQVDIVTLSQRRPLIELQEAAVRAVLQNTDHDVATTSADTVPEAPGQLNEEVIKITGEEPDAKEGELILSSHISSRWSAWLKSGQKKEVRENLLKKLPCVGSCLLEALKLNPEVVASLTDTALKRDKHFANPQNLAGSALAALGTVIDPLLVQKKENWNLTKILEGLWEASQLLTEIHRGQTLARKTCIIPSLTKQVANVLEKT